MPRVTCASPWPAFTVIFVPPPAPAPPQGNKVFLPVDSSSFIASGRVLYSEIDNKDFVSRFTLTPKNAVNKQPTITGYPTAAFLLVGNTKNGLLEMYG